MKYLVTGATGFLGMNVVSELVKAGHDVRASGMHGSETKYLERLPVEVMLADITNADEVDSLVDGCDVVLHVAGDRRNRYGSHPNQWHHRHACGGDDDARRLSYRPQNA